METIRTHIQYWIDYKGTSDEYRRAHDLDCILTDGNLNADTLIVYSDRVEHSARRFRADLSPFQSNLSALLSTPFRKSSAYLSGDECNDRFNIPPESLFRAL